jgi:hypothetical protein
VIAQIPTNVYELWPKQLEALRLLGLWGEPPADGPVEELFWGGEAGAGKSNFLRALAYLLCSEIWPGCTVALFRRTFQELHDNHLLKFQEEIPPDVARYNATDHEWTFYNGSVLQLRYCEHEADAFKYQGSEWAALLVDEASHLTREQYTYLRSRVRWPKTKPMRAPWRRIIVSASNPGNVGHMYFKEHFVDAAPPETIFYATDVEAGYTPWKRYYLRARLTDNPSITEEEYRATLSGIADPVLRRAMQKGDWSIHAGQMFTIFDRDIHTCREFTVPSDWPTRWTGYDYGRTAPACNLWATRVPAGEELPIADSRYRVSERPRILLYREFYEAGFTVERQALRIRIMERDEKGIRKRYADPSIWSKQHNGPSIADEFRLLQLRMVRANNDRLAGIARVHRALDYDDLDGPELVIMQNCRNLIRTLPNLPRDKENPEDVKSRDVEDHGYDAMRYLLQGERIRKDRRVEHYRIGTKPEDDSDRDLWAQLTGGRRA